MSSPAAWAGLHTKFALAWWVEWGMEVPDLQFLALKLVPLMIGSGPAERTWKDVGNILTKNRNRLGVAKCIDLVFVRTWLRRELKLVSDEELEQLKEWETELLSQASLYTGDADPDSGEENGPRIFEDRFEAWEQPAIDGRGVVPRIRLGDVKANKPARFRLQEKYKGMFLLDKDPSDENGFYDGDVNDPMPRDQWEHRRIWGVEWTSRKVWFAATKICNAPSGASENYVIDEVLIRMIKDSPRNRGVRFRSEM